MSLYDSWDDGSGSYIGIDPYADYTSTDYLDLGNSYPSDAGSLGNTYAEANPDISYSDWLSSPSDIGLFADATSPSWLTSLGSYLDPLAQFTDKYGSLIAGGAGLLGNLYAYSQQQDLLKARREAEQAQADLNRQQAASLAAQDKNRQDTLVLDRAGDIDKTKLILGRMQEKGMLAPGINPNELLGRMYSNNQQVFNNAPYSLNTFANNPYAQVPVWTPLASESVTQNLAYGGMVEPMSSGGLAALSKGQADTVPINVSGGEYVVPADTVADLGDGNSNAGGLALDAMVAQVRKHKGRTNKLPPKAKSPTSYMKGR